MDAANVSIPKPYFKPYTEQKLDAYWTKYLGYTVQGLALSITNIIILLTIGIHRRLREHKEYRILAGLASVDAITGLGALSAGVGRLLIIQLGLAQGAVSSRWCLRTPWSWLMIIKPHVNGLMLLMISVDRFVAVAFPMKYFVYDRKYSLITLSIPYLHALGPFVYLIYKMIISTEEVNRPFCFTSAYMGTGKWTYYRYTEPLFSTASALLYAVVLAVFLSKKPPATLTRDAKAKNKRNRKVTIAIGVTCLCTLCFETFPRLVTALSSQLGGRSKLKTISVVGGFLYYVSLYQYEIRNLNPLMNIFIYSLRMREIRVGIKKLFVCKKLTDYDLEQTTRKPTVRKIAVKPK